MLLGRPYPDERATRNVVLLLVFTSLFLQVAAQRRKEAVIIERQANPLSDCGMFSFFIALAKCVNDERCGSGS